uniref:Uncharacterized protein n=1 Tax=Romanomermis culicivorax TaxID=13658 RepID=A0A915IGT4_ROMCU
MQELTIRATLECETDNGFQKFRMDADDDDLRLYLDYSVLRGYTNSQIIERQGPQRNLGIRYLHYALRSTDSIYVTHQQVADVALVMNPDADQQILRNNWTGLQPRAFSNKLMHRFLGLNHT